MTRERDRSLRFTDIDVPGDPETMVKILAVSGGVDSMVMLDIMKDDPCAVVAHFNHGTRPSADEDEKFVEEAAFNYGLEFYCGHAELGEFASEAECREARYDYFMNLGHQFMENSYVFDHPVYTAHHLDDLIETIAINFTRGTGWLGLAPLSNFFVKRPLISMTKTDILRYAAEHDIVYRQDPTNAEDRYLRNRLRPKVLTLPPETKQSIYELYQRQRQVREELGDIMYDDVVRVDRRYPRSWFTDDDASMEMLRMIMEYQYKINLTRPQAKDFLHAILTYAPEKKFNLPGDRFVTIHKDCFFVEDAPDGIESMEL